MDRGGALKTSLHQFLCQKTEEKIADLQENLSSLEDSKTNESKSTAGDKHETGRAMIQIEEDQIRHQLSVAIQTQQRLKSITPKEVASTKIVRLGSLVETNHGIFYIAVGEGKVIHEEETFFVVSADSPIGQQLIGKEEGSAFEFLQRRYQILSVV